MSLAVLILGAILIVLGTMAAGHRAGIWISGWLVRLPPDLGAWIGLLIGLAIAGKFLAETVPLAT
jgi:hypothetical protein